MAELVKVKRLRGATVLRLVIIGYALGFACLCAVLGVPASFGIEILKWNGQYITGPVALVASPLIGLLTGLLMGIFNACVIYIGLRVFARFRNFDIEYYALED